MRKTDPTNNQVWMFYLTKYEHEKNIYLKCVLCFIIVKIKQVIQNF